MFRKKLTFVVIPDSSQTARQVSTKVWYLWAGLAGAAALVFVSFFLASAYLSGEVDQAELDRLRVENKELADKYEEIRWSMAEVDARYNDLVRKEIALRQVFDLPEINLEERQLGVGGPDGLSNEDLSESKWLAHATEAEIDRLLRLSSFELEKYAEVEAGMHDLKDRLDHTPSIWPTKGWLSRGYGMKNDPFTGYRRLHRGIDISNNTGTPIFAPAAGRVQSILTDRGMGKVVVIDHGYGFVTRYGHLSQIGVKRGQLVERGEELGKMGSTGYSTGPHLHYEVWRNGKVLNPMDFILNDM
jgi:murein DD-endopeptidase MepM/ murein hydrolase activator NlpD